MDDQLLRQFPKVDELLRDPLLAGCCRTLPQQTVTQAIRQALEELRREILAGTLGALPEQPELCRKDCRFGGPGGLAVSAERHQWHRHCPAPTWAEPAFPSRRPGRRGVQPGITPHWNMISKPEAGACAMRMWRAAVPSHRSGERFGGQQQCVGSSAASVRPGPGWTGGGVPRGTGGNRRLFPGAGYYGGLRRNIAGSGDHQQDPFAGLCRCHRPETRALMKGTYQQLPHCGLYGSTAAFRADGIGPQPRPARR